MEASGGYPSDPSAHGINSPDMPETVDGLQKINYDEKHFPATPKYRPPPQYEEVNISDSKMQQHLRDDVSSDQPKTHEGLNRINYDDKHFPSTPRSRPPSQYEYVNIEDIKAQQNAKQENVSSDMPDTVEGLNKINYDEKHFPSTPKSRPSPEYENVNINNNSNSQEHDEDISHETISRSDPVSTLSNHNSKSNHTNSQKLPSSEL